jgi:hypothetical protein
VTNLQLGLAGPAAAGGAGLFPAGSAAFHLVLAVHIAAGLACVVTGATAALSPKRHGRHPWFGSAYYWSLAVVSVTAATLAGMRWPQDAYLLVLGMLSFAAASVGRLARRRRCAWRLQGGWATAHIVGMSTSYIVLLTAFYADNGKNLPVWRDLPHLTYWLLPGAIGLPLVARALVRYRGLRGRARPPGTASAPASGASRQPAAQRPEPHPFDATQER